MEKLSELEHRNLREELHDLKRCQIIFLQLSVTATGVLLGLTVRWELAKSSQYIYLLPLTIVLPSWWVFFDKATTISRAVGYYRILERIIRGDANPPKWVGWENSLRLFRKEYGNIKPPPAKENRIWGFIKLVFLQQPFRYWMIVFYTFLGLSGICWYLTFLQDPSGWIWLAALAIIGFTAFVNISLVYQLVLGRYSYAYNEGIWEKILRIEPKKPDET